MSSCSGGDSSVFKYQMPLVKTGMRPEEFVARSGSYPLPKGNNIVHDKNYKNRIFCTELPNWNFVTWTQNFKFAQRIRLACMNCRESTKISPRGSLSWFFSVSLYKTKWIVCIWWAAKGKMLQCWLWSSLVNMYHLECIMLLDGPKKLCFRSLCAHLSISFHF